MGAPFIVGSLPSTFDYGENSFQPYTGCIRNINVDDKLLDFSDALLAKDLLVGCQSSSGRPCDQNRCSNGGKCVDYLSSFYCECPHKYVGDTCSKGTIASEYINTILNCTSLKFYHTSIAILLVCIQYAVVYSGQEISVRCIMLIPFIRIRVSYVFWRKLHPL